ncbi:MAG: hypothetical protein Q27BPR15_13010 [Rhodobacter sp. CACIA14H1]|nr:MAG: hypothetical protein Q27BPR15_13010 [Rhodobacter sp. CACIA14H1]
MPRRAMSIASIWLGGQTLHSLEIGLTNLEVILHNLPERAEGQVELPHLLARLRPDVEDQPPLADRQTQPIGPGRHLAPLPHGQREGVLLQQVEYRHPPLLLDLRRRAGKAPLVNLDMADAAHGRPLFTRRVMPVRNRQRKGDGKVCPAR